MYAKNFHFSRPETFRRVLLQAGPPDRLESETTQTVDQIRREQIHLSLSIRLNYFETARRHRDEIEALESNLPERARVVSAALRALGEPVHLSSSLGPNERVEALR